MISALTLVAIVGLSDLLHSRGLSVPPATGKPLPQGLWRRTLLVAGILALSVPVALTSPWWALPGVLLGYGAWLFTYRERNRGTAMVVTGIVLIALLGPVLLASPVPLPDGWGNYQRILLAAALLLVNLTTANRVVRMVLRLTGAPSPDPDSGEPRAGRVIGVLERILLIGLIVAGQGVSIAGVAAAKSIIRYPEISKAARDEGGLSAEVFFVGTVTSWLIALASAGLVAVGL